MIDWERMRRRMSFMTIGDLLSFMEPEDWVWVGDSHGQVYYGWAGHMQESVRDLEVGSVSGDRTFPGVIDIYVKEER